MTTDAEWAEIAEFEDTYKPVASSDDGDMVQEFDAVRNIDPRFVWTLVDGDSGASYAIPGFHIVNKFGYVVTEIPWPNEDVEYLWAPASDEEED